MKKLTIQSSTHPYQVILDDNLESLIQNELDPSVRYFVIMDEVLKARYSGIFPNAVIYFLKGGEEIKNLKTYEKIVSFLLENHMNKNDVLIAFGGGTVSDVTGFTASTYKRGVRYINIPTTTLSMVDASIGGKTALNMGETKNAIGAIYPPEKVLIGLDTLSSLREKEINNGLYEALKTGLILDPELFTLFKEGKEKENLKEVLFRSLNAKKSIVEQDEKDNGVRKILNFGHTFGHALELSYGLGHGESIANGMLIMSQGKPYYPDLKAILIRMKCPVKEKIDWERIRPTLLQDKKWNGQHIETVMAEEVGRANIIKMNLSELERIGKNYVF